MSSAARKLVPVPARPRVILPYERVSAIMGRDDEAFRSPDIQRDANLRSIADAGAIVYQDAVDNPERYRDIDRTGRDFNREGIQRALDLKRRGLIDGIAVLDVSRVGRTTSETLEVIEEFRTSEGVFLSSRERFDDSPTGEWMLTIMVGMAQLYSDNIAAGWRAVIADRASKGLHNGTPPMGYDFARDAEGNTIKPSRIVLDEQRAPYVREAFRRFDAGESATSIARWLQSAGVWNQIGISRLLSNPFYLGDVRLKVYTGKAKRRQLVKDAPPVVMQGKGQHPVLLTDKHGRPDRDLFDRVATRLAENKGRARRHINPVHALGGLAKCAHPACGRALVLSTHRVSGVEYRYLICQARRHDKSAVCPGIGAANIGNLEACVLDEVRRLWEGYALGVGDAGAAIASRDAARAERERIEAAILKCERAITDMDADFYDERLPADRHARLTERKTAELQRLSAELLTYELDDAPTLPDFMDAARALLDTWETSSPADRNRMLRACGVKAVRVGAPARYRQPVAERTEVVFSI